MPSLSTASNPLDQSNPLSLPRYLTTFVGRQVELAEIRMLLQNADCRLLTLVGQWH
jgi:hypothetical protein